MKNLTNVTTFGSLLQSEIFHVQKGIQVDKILWHENIFDPYIFVHVKNLRKNKSFCLITNSDESFYYLERGNLWIISLKMVSKGFPDLKKKYLSRKSRNWKIKRKKNSIFLTSFRVVVKLKTTFILRMIIQSDSDII